MYVHFLCMMHIFILELAGSKEPEYQTANQVDEKARLHVQRHCTLMTLRKDQSFYCSVCMMHIFIQAQLWVLQQVLGHYVIHMALLQKLMYIQVSAF